ncbi:MAG: heterodisulfide reductase-related iron-sulfur binding cluster [Dissulfurispiraceae bacterium]
MLYAQWIREGRLKVDPSWNTEGQKFTCQDPCNLVRKGLGNSAADDLRFIIKACAGEENFVDMWPNKSNNFCCGGGGGAHQAGFKDKKHAYGKFKFDQVVNTKADVVITPCHNCHGQLEQICDKYGGDYHTYHLWNLIMKALVR